MDARKPTQQQLDRWVIDEILRASHGLGIGSIPLDEDYVTNLRIQLSSKFGEQKKPLTFQSMNNKESIQNPDGWFLLSQFLKPVPHVLFYDSPGYFDRAGVRFMSGLDVSNVIGECFGFPFYVTDEANSFVVGMNDHDYLIGVGTAAPWIASLRQQMSPE